MEYNLFDGPSAGASDREPMVEGAVLLRGKALAFERDLFSALTTVTERAGRDLPCTRTRTRGISATRSYRFARSSG
jgi:hypothetical protein